MIWGVNLCVFWCLHRIVFRDSMEFRDEGEILPYLALSNLMIYGVSWGISAFQSSPTFAVAGGLVSPLLIWLGLNFGAFALELPALGENAGAIYSMICPPLGIAGFSLGTWYFLTRVEP